MRRKRHMKYKKPRNLRRYAGLVAGVFAGAIALKAVTVLGGVNAASVMLENLVSGDGAALRLMDMELNREPPEPDWFSALFGEAGSDNEHATEAPEGDSSPVFSEQSAAPTGVPATEPTPDEPVLFYTGAYTAPEHSDGLTLSVENIIIKNNSGLTFDAQVLLNTPVKINVSADAPNVLIIHTHSSEAYTGDYEPSDPYRTEDKSNNIIAVGDVLAEKLAEYGLNVIHDRGVYDFPSYSGSYGRTLEKVKEYLKQHPEIDLVIDLHRDAMESADGKQFTTIANIGSVRCAQVMLVVGTNASGLSHPDWRENLGFALRLQYAMNRDYPTLSRPVTISQYRYNQHLAPGYLIVEIGAAGNTLEEAKLAAEYFAQTYARTALSIAG